MSKEGRIFGFEKEVEDESYSPLAPQPIDYGLLSTRDFGELRLTEFFSQALYRKVLGQFG